jgi:hypothetical protein
MPLKFSKARLSKYVKEFVDRSKSLDSKGQFRDKDIAELVFGRTDKYAAQHFSAAISPTNEAPLRQGQVVRILEACNHLLEQQYQVLRIPNAYSPITQFEREVCQRLRISSNGPATLDDFREIDLIANATNVEEFGLPDLLDWSRRSYDFATDLRNAQRYSMDTLRAIRDWIATCGDKCRRLQLAYVAVSASTLNPPGSQWHEDAFNSAMKIAAHAQVWPIAADKHERDDLRQQAIRVEHRLRWSRVSPLLNSPCNYMRYALFGQKMPSEVWAGIEHTLGEAVIGVRREYALDPTNQRVIRHMSATQLMKARLLLVAGRATDAEQMYKESLLSLEHVSSPAPYRYVYPILRDLVRTRFKHALHNIEMAIAAFESAEMAACAMAFAALHIHVSHLFGNARQGGHRNDPTADSHIRKLAARAVASPVIRYEFSHVFDPATIRQLLYPNTPRGR